MSFEQRAFKNKTAKGKASAQVVHRSRQHAAQVQLNGVICATADEGGVNGVLDLVESRHLDMNLVNLSTALHRIARSSSTTPSMERRNSSAGKQDARMTLLQDRTREELQRCATSTKKEPYARCLSTISWSYARLQSSDSKLMQEVGDLAALQLPSFKPLELANLLYGFAKLQMPHETLFQLAHGHILATLSRSSAANLSMFAWSFATIKFQNCADLFGALTDMFAAHVTSNTGGGQSEVNPVVIENMIWALATARVRAKKANLRVMGDAATSVLREFKAHELAITLWAFARLDVYHEELLAQAAALLRKSKVLRNDLHAQGVTNILWAFAKHVQQARENKAHTSRSAPFWKLLSDLMPVCKRLLPDMKPIEISTTIKAVSSLAGSFGAHPAVDRFFVELANQLNSEGRVFARLSQESAKCMLATCSVFFQDRADIPETCKLLMMRLMRGRDGFRQRSDEAAEQYQTGYEMSHADWPMLGNASTSMAINSHISMQPYPITCGDSADEAALLEACEAAIGSGVGFPMDVSFVSPTSEADGAPPEPVYLYPSCTLQTEGRSSGPAYVNPSFIGTVDSKGRVGSSSASTATPCRIDASKFSSCSSSQVSLWSSDRWTSGVVGSHKATAASDIFPYKGTSAAASLAQTPTLLSADGSEGKAVEHATGAGALYPPHPTPISLNIVEEFTTINSDGIASDEPAIAFEVEANEDSGPIDVQVEVLGNGTATVDVQESVEALCSGDTSLHVVKLPPSVASVGEVLCVRAFSQGGKALSNPLIVHLQQTLCQERFIEETD